MGSMRVKLTVVFIALLLTLSLVSCGDSGTKEATNNFNVTADEIGQLQDDLSSKISEAEKLLAGTKPEELADPNVLEQLKTEVEAAKGLSVDIPAIASEKNAITEQVQDITTQKEKLQKQYNSLASAVSAIATSKQKLAEQKAETLVGAGIIAISADYPSDKKEGKTITLTSIDPKTGATKVVRKFSSVGKSFELEDLSPSAFYARQIFDSKYKRVAAKKTFESDGSTHVGWVDESGAFFDVTNAVTSGSQGDFSGAILQSTGRFGPDDYFYYYDAKQKGDGYISSMDITIRRVPSSNPSKDKVESMNGKVSQNSYYIQPNGFPDNTEQTFYPMSDSSGEYFCFYPGGLYDWVNRTTFIEGFYEDTIYIYDALTDKNGNDNRRPLLPDVKDRNNWNGIVSPDGSQVAFLSYLTTGSEPPGLFIVPSSGGEPVKVPTSYTFVKTEEQILGTSGTLQLLVWK